MELAYHFYIDASPERVWEVLTSDDGVSHTFFGCTIRSTFQVGDDYAYVGPGEDGPETVHVYGKILDFVPNVQFSMTEHPGPAYNPEHEKWETRITFKLEPMGSITKLTLLHDEWPDDHPSFANTQSHWPMVLSNIKTYAESGKTLDFGW